MGKTITKISISLMLFCIAFFANANNNEARADWSTPFFGGFGSLYDMSSDGNYLYNLITGFGSDTAYVFISSLNPALNGDSMMINHSRTLSWFKVTPDGNSILFAFDSGYVDVWNLAQKTKTFTIPDFNTAEHNRTTQFRISDDSKVLTCMLCGDTATTVRKWDLTNGQLLSEFVIAEQMRNSNIAISHNGNFLALINSVTDMKGWDLTKNKMIFNTPESQNFLSVLTMAISDNGKYVAFNDNNPKFQIYDVFGGKYQKFYSYTGYPNGVFQFLDSNRLMLDSKSDLVIYDCSTASAQTYPGFLENVYKTSLQNVPLTKNLDKALISFQKQISCQGSNVSLSYMRLADMTNYTYLMTIPNVHLNSIAGVALSRDGNFALSRDLDSLVNIWDVNTGMLLGQTHNGDAAVFSPADNNILMADGNKINVFVGSNDSIINTWTTTHGNIINMICDTMNNVVAETDNAIMFINYPDGVVKNVVLKNSPGQYLLKLSTDKTQLYAVDSLFTVYKYEISTGNLIASFNISHTTDMLTPTKVLDITPDGKFLATIDITYTFPVILSTLYLWDVNTGVMYDSLHNNTIALKFSNDSWKYWLYTSTGRSSVYNIYTKQSSCNQNNRRNPLSADNSNIILSNDGRNILIGECTGRVSYIAMCDLFVPVIEDYQPGPQDNTGNIAIVPNPANDFITFNNVNAGDIGNIQVFTLLGTKVIESPFTERLDVSSLQPGMYFVKIKTQVCKFVKY